MATNSDRQWREDALAVLRAGGLTTDPAAATQAARVVRLIDEAEDLEARNANQQESLRGFMDIEDRLSAREGECQAKAHIIEDLERKLKRARESTKASAVAALERKVAHLEGWLERAKARDANNSAGMRRLYERMRTAEEERDRLVAKLGRGRLRDLDVDARTVLDVDHVMQFPKHRGETLGHVAGTDPTYVVWLDEEHSTHRPSAAALQIAYDVIAGAKRRQRGGGGAPEHRVDGPLDKIRRGIEKGQLGFMDPPAGYGGTMAAHGIDCPDESLVTATVLGHNAMGPSYHWLGGDAERFHRSGRNRLT